MDSITHRDRLTRNVSVQLRRGIYCKCGKVLRTNEWTMFGGGLYNFPVCTRTLSEGSVFHVSPRGSNGTGGGTRGLTSCYNGDHAYGFPFRRYGGRGVGRCIRTKTSSGVRGEILQIARYLRSARATIVRCRTCETYGVGLGVLYERKWCIVKTIRPRRGLQDGRYTHGNRSAHGSGTRNRVYICHLSRYTMIFYAPSLECGCATTREGTIRGTCRRRCGTTY